MVYKGAWEKALKYLALRPRTSKQVEEYLLKKGYEHSEIIDVIERLIAVKYLNDDRFAEGFVRARAEHKFHGPFRLRRDLISRGIDSNTADRALNEIFSYVDITDVIDNAIAKWVRINGSPMEVKDTKRLNDYLFRLGYEPGLIREKTTTLGVSDEEQ